MNPVKRLIQFGKKLLPRIGILTLAVILSKDSICKCRMSGSRSHSNGYYRYCDRCDTKYPITEYHGNKIVIGFCDYHIFWIY